MGNELIDFAGVAIHQVEEGGIEELLECPADLINAVGSPGAVAGGFSEFEEVDFLGLTGAALFEHPFMELFGAGGQVLSKF